MEQTFRYKAFISYSHRDEKWASWLHRAIETYRVPRYLVGQQTPMGVVPARTSPVFRDRDELASATDLGTKLREALEGSGCLLVICSPASASSHWVNEEILAFKRLGRADRIFALIVGGEPYASGMPGREQEECFPPALRSQLGEDGNLSLTPAEPIAADAREGKDGKSNAQIKLLAGMLGVGFDALRQREHQRRQRRLAIIAGGSLAGMVVAIVLATTAVIARNEAERQRSRAEKETETARKVSSFMVGLFKVVDPSEARGKSITAREILTAGAGRINTELNGEPAVQAELMDTIGTVYAGLGLYDDASAMLTHSLEKRRGLPGIEPRAIAGNQVQLADVLTAKAELKSAEALYIEAIASLDASESESESENPAKHQRSPETVKQLAAALAGLAEVYYQTGRYTDAEPILQRVLDLRRRSLPPTDPAIADAIEQLGLNQWDQGNLEQSEKLLRESLAMRRKALGDAPHPDTAVNLNNLALLLMDLKQYTESETLLRNAMEIYHALYGETHPEIATGLNNLGLLYRAEGDLVHAEDNYRQALEMQRTLLGPEHPEVARSLNNLAFVLYDEREVDAAIDSLRNAVELWRKSLGTKHLNTANGMAALGRWIAVRGPSDEAETLVRDAIAALVELQGPEHEDVGKAEIGLAHALKWKPDKREALTVAQRASTRLKTLLGDDDWLVAYAVSTEGSVLSAMGRLDEAEPLLKAGYEKLAGTPEAGRAYVWLARDALIALYEQQGRQDLALSLRNDVATP